MTNEKATGKREHLWLMKSSTAFSVLLIGFKLKWIKNELQ